MLLKELLNVTTLNTVIKIEGIDSNRIKKNMTIINCKNDYGRIDDEPLNNSIEKYGDHKVIHQHIQNNTLTILIKI